MFNKIRWIRLLSIRLFACPNFEWTLIYFDKFSKKSLFSWKYFFIRRIVSKYCFCSTFQNMNAQTFLKNKELSRWSFDEKIILLYFISIPVESLISYCCDLFWMSLLSFAAEYESMSGYVSPFTIAIDTWTAPFICTYDRNLCVSCHVNAIYFPSWQYIRLNIF